MLELTEREKAIARGEDPDSATTNAEQSVNTPEAEASDEIASSNAVTEEGSTAGGTDAADKTPATQDDEGLAWIDDGVRELGKSYGLSDDELKQFGSADEFRRAGRLIDRNLSKQNSSVEKKPEQAAATAVPAEEEKIELDPEKYKAAGYDEETINLVKFAKKLQERVGQLEPEVVRMRDRANEELRRAQAQAFHSEVDGMDEGRYGRAIKNGKTAAISQAQEENRRKLHSATLAIATGLSEVAKAEGKQPQALPMGVLLKRAEMLAFGEEIQEQTRRKLESQAKSQSNKRRPVGAPRNSGGSPASSGGADPGDQTVKRAMGDKALKEFWEKAQQQNGSE